MSISTFDSALSVVSSAIQGLGLSGQSKNANKSPQSFAQIVVPSTNPGTNSGQQSGSSISVTGVNTGQLAQVAVSSVGQNGQFALQGSVLQAAKAATLTVVGGSGATVSGGGSYQLSGNIGSTTLVLNQGESLATVASQVNQSTQKTGVTAAVTGNNLVLSSTSVGGNSTINFQPLQQSSEVVSGVNSAQVGSFQVVNQTAGTTDVISGNVISSASQAELIYQGASNGTVAGTATFQLTGALGSTNISMTQGESLSAVAGQINQQTASTGVLATVQNTNLILTSNATGAGAIVQVSNVNATQQVSESGINSSQVTAVNINSIAANSSQQLTGEVVQSATQAQLALQGTGQDTVQDTAAFQLTGALGSTDISIQQGESLSDVAAAVNAQTNTTGVVASVANHQVVFQSSNVGSAANVSIQLQDITHTTVVSGVDSQQLSSFQTNTLTTGASDTLSGQVTQAATQATVTLQGSNQDTVVDTATFQLTGSLGSTNVSIQQGESLSDVAAAVNTQTNTTGVVASVSNHQVVFQSSNVGSAANVAVQLTDITHTTVVSGINSQQVSSFQTNSLTTGASDTISGQVTQAATQATAKLQGTSSDTVAATATFQLTGALGSTSVSITQGQALSAVATQINAQAASTGVVASVSNHQLVFQSSGVGSASSVKVQLTNISYSTTVSGVNSQQLSSFQVNSFTNGASETLNGSVTQTATNAQLTYTGSLGLTFSNSTFTLQGSQGSVQISTTFGESLSSIASQINSSTSSTGVTASVSGNVLTFNSTTVGSSALVKVRVTSGSFSVSGGNGSGTANGTNAVATINGHSITGNGNSFQYSDSLGNYSFTTASGYTGTISPVTVTSQAGQFSLSGVNANGTANGTDAVATINGKTITASGSTFQYADSVGSYTLTTASGYTGTIGPISVVSQAGQFTLGGGNGNGTANGTNAIATINGQTITGTGNAFQYADGVGSYSFTTASGYTGTINPVSIVSQAGQFEVTGGNGEGAANGTDAVATINGQTITGTGNSIEYSNDEGSFQIQLASGYQGALSPITIQSQAEPFDVQGGNGDGLAQGTNLVAVINGVQQSDSTNQATVQGTNGTYQISFAKGFVGQFNPISATNQVNVTTIGGNQAHGTNAIADINGQIQVGNGATFTYSNQGSSATLQFAPGFQGAFDPVSVSQGGQSAPNGSAASQASNQSSDSAAANSGSSLYLLQQGINQGLIQFQFDQLRNVLDQISEAGEQVSASTRHATNETSVDSATQGNTPAKNSSDAPQTPQAHVNLTPSSQPSIGSHLSVLA